MMPLIPVFLSAIVAAWPLFGPRFIPTHDGEYHIIRFWQYFEGLGHGVAFPRWAADMNHGFGIPLFTFQYPFPNIVGSVIHALGFSYVDSVKWTLAAGYITAVVCSYFWLAGRFGKRAAMAGAIAGAFVPYWFVDLYVRGSVGEVWAMAWVFATLTAIFYGMPVLVTAGIMMTVLSHNILAMLFAPVLFAYALSNSRKAAVAVLLGVGAASFFWVPALFEQRFIAGLSPVNVFDHFPELYQLLIPSWGTGFRGSVGGGNEMSYQLGVVPVIAYVASLFLVVRKRKTALGEQLFALMLMTLAVFGMLPISHGIWRAVSYLSFVQYPWRLLSVTIVAVPVFVASLTRTNRIGWLLPVLAVIASWSYMHPVTYEPRNDRDYLTNESFAGGTSALGNAFQTRWPVTASASGTVVYHGGDVKRMEYSYLAYDLAVEGTVSAALTVPSAYYPGWEARIDGRRIATAPSPDGTVSVDIPPGTHRVRIALAETPWQVAAWAASILSLWGAAMCFIAHAEVPRPKGRG